MKPNFPKSFFTSPLPPLERHPFEITRDWIIEWEKLASRGAAVLLESAGPTGSAGRWTILAGDPELEVFSSGGRLWWGKGSDIQPASFDVWDFLDWICPNEEQFLPLPLCLARAWFSAFSYEFGSEGFSKAKGRTATLKEVPDFYFFKPRFVAAFNRDSKKYFIFGKENWKPEEISIPQRDPFHIQSLFPRMGRSHYEEMVNKAKEYISRGDIYQANLAQSFQGHWKGSVGNLYRFLKEVNPAPFMGLFQGRDFTIVSSSPERLVAGQGSFLETRPVAGTRPRGTDSAEDVRLKWELKTNAKEQAEHLMLVDLLRNDLGRVAKYGTVDVKSFAEVESYAKVHHLVSIIQAHRKTSLTISSVLKSVFPGGTITGCPKVRCMEIIKELEGRPRGFYTGSIGYLSPGPCFDLSILIRTFTLFSNGSFDFYAGAGIVADSEPEREYMETLYKVEALAQALGTTLLSNGS